MGTNWKTGVFGIPFLIISVRNGPSVSFGTNIIINAMQAIIDTMFVNEKILEYI